MRDAIRIRLVAFLTLIAAILGSIGMAGFKSYKTFDQFRRRLAYVQLESFRLADHLQQSLLELNNSLVRYSMLAGEDEYRRFKSKSIILKNWMEQQNSPLRTSREQDLLKELKTRYCAYLNLVDAYRERRKSSDPIQTLPQLTRLQSESETLLGVSYQLASAHQESLGEFLEAAKDSEHYFKNLIYAALFLLVGIGTLAVLMVYRDMIAPLRLKLVESELIIHRQEKLAALGMLAAGIAHEIRNPLTAIKARLFTLKSRLSDDKSSHEDSDVIHQEIGRLERIVQDFLQFARPSEPRFAIVSASVPLREVHTLLASSLKKNEIELRLELDVRATIKVDPHQMKQVLINLVQNAAESIEGRGVVTLRIALDSARLRNVPCKVAVLEVEDSGKGISHEIERRLFDPFFTTKETGTGLGLSVALQILEKHGGTLRYKTQVNRGTTFGIVLPLIENETPA